MIIGQFISETKVKELIAINGNVDPMLIKQVIMMCQREYIEPIVGTGIYNELNTQVAGSTLTTLNRTLLDEYVIPCLVAYVKMESVIELNYKFTNKNVSTKNSENSTPLSLEDCMKLSDRYKIKAEYNAERITKYLMQNRNSYPLYISQTFGFDTVYPSYSNYETGMVLDNGYCKRCTYENSMCKCS